MEDLIKIKALSDSIKICDIHTDKFKTSRISVNMAMPLRRETAAVNAILPFLLHRSCRKYPNFSLLNERLAELYGANVSADVVKLGEVQVMRICISAINDKFALSDENITAECAALLCSMIFDPSLENGIFKKEDVEREKRLLVEKIESEINEKRIYALKRCESIMCENEAFGIDRLGTKETVEALDGQKIYDAWQRCLKTARVQINIIESGDSSDAIGMLKDGFQKAGREKAAECKTEIIRTAGKTREVEEKQPINQGKLVMGFRAGTADPDSSVIAARVMTDLFGGGPYSRLFMNVREKLSLCYYCAAIFDRHKGLLIVQSGIESENKDKAIAEIKKQLDIVKNGSFEDSELLASKMGLSDLFRGFGDTPFGLDSWYLEQMFSPQILSLSEYSKKISEVSREQVTAAAGKVSLDTVYMLSGTGKEEK